MKKSTLVLGAAICMSSMPVLAEEYVTPGDGSAYSFESLSAISGSNVAKTADGVYEVSDDITISEGDSFTLDKGAVIKFASDVRVSIEGTSVMDGGEERTLFTRIDENAEPAGIWAQSPAVFNVKNVDFEYIGLTDHSAEGAVIENCSFSFANGKMSSIGALNCGSTEASYTVTGSRFSECTVPGIGTGANTFCNLLIEDCDFFDNNSSNTNKPQLNLTVGCEYPVVVRGCTVTGTGRDKVGGISVSNLLVAPGSNKVYIENNKISENRYGITATGPLYIEIRNNELVNNCHDPNPMSGGSGISLAGYYYGQSGIISGNYIEGHLWGITLIQCEDINCGEVDNPDSPGGNVFKDNGNNGMAYDLYNNGRNKVYAQLNTWSVAEQTEELIETVISHFNDDPSLGEVIFMPAAEGDAVETVDALPSDARYFNLQGVEVSEPASGIYIMRRGDKTSKVVVR